MTPLTDRLSRRVGRDFGPHAERVSAALAALPEAIASRQDPERIQAAVVIASGGSLVEFEAMMALARLDWRDLLVSGGLAQGDWALVLDQNLGR